MTNQEMLKRVEELVEVLEIKFKKHNDYTEPRCNTTWGTKTRKGLIATISRIIYEET